MKRRWEEKLKHVEHLAATYERHPLCPSYRPRLYRPWQPASVWRLFPRQSTAFNFAKSYKEDVHVFALENKEAETGKRFYLVTTYTEFWFYYRSPRQSLMHCYEVIPAESVCKLYFDLEFYKPANPGANGKQLVAKLIQYVCQKLEELYGIRCSEKDVLNMDSSTEDKFSRHLIFLLQGAAFKDNTHVGNFVRKILQPAITELQRANPVRPLEGTQDTGFLSATVTRDLATDVREQCRQKEESVRLLSKRPKMSEDFQNADLSFLITRDKEDSCHLFVDLAVYTKNRNFRLYKSSKAGKTAAFEVAEDNKFVPKPEKNISVEEQLFLCSLVSNVRFSDSLKILTCDSPDVEKSKGCISQDSLNPGTSASTVSGYQWSPYPEIDRFVLSLVTQSDIKGGIRRWNYFSTDELIVYDISKYRMCENIGRPHKSNNIMIIADLKKEVWYQKCHDPACRAAGFKSKSYPLPFEICLEFLFTAGEEESACSMDDDGNIVEHQTTSQPLSDVQRKEDNTFNACQTEYVDRDWDDEIDDKLCLEAVTTNWNEGTDNSCVKAVGAGWNNDVDDDSCLEAAEDAELCIAAGDDLSQWSCNEPEVPDDLMLAAVREHEASWSSEPT